MLLRCQVVRGAQGLGLSFNSRNEIVEIAPHGQADSDGLLLTGDHVMAIDDKPLGERPLSQVLEASRSSFSFTVRRDDPDLKASIARLPSDSPFSRADAQILLLKLRVTRDANGLGLDMTGQNVLKSVVAGGAAEISGGWQSGDLIVAVEGKKLGAARLVDILPRGLPAYDFLVLRVEKKKTVSESGTRPLAVVKAKLDTLPTGKPVKKDWSLLSEPVRVTPPTVSTRAEEECEADGEQGGGRGGLLELLIGGWGTQARVIRVAGEEYSVTRQLKSIRSGEDLFEARRVEDRELVRLKQASASGPEREWTLREGGVYQLIFPPGAPSHENILKLYEQHALSDGMVYTVTELCHEQPLADELEARVKTGGFGEDEIAMISADICGGLDHLHSQSPPIAYRALSLQTVVLGLDGRWKLSDFRLCTTRSKVLKSKEELEVEGAEVQKIERLNRAPELDNLYSRELISVAVDVWATGCVLYQLLFKKHPFRKATIITDNWALPKGRWSKEPLIAALCECLKLFPADRPTAGSLVHCFDAIAEGKPIPKLEYGAASLAANTEESKVSTNKATPSAIHLRVAVARGPQGLGFALGSDNKVAAIVPGGRAERDGLLEVGDEIVEVDDTPLDGRPMGAVIDRSATMYSFLLTRYDTAMQESMDRLPSGNTVRSSSELELLNLNVTRDENGLGLDVSSTNVLKRIVPGGAADKCGGWRTGDLITSVNGQKLRGNRLVKVLPSGLPEYQFSVLRPSIGPIRRPVCTGDIGTKQDGAPGCVSETQPSSSGNGADPVETKTAKQATSTSIQQEPPKEEKKAPSDDANLPTDTQLLEFMLLREGRSRAGLYAIYSAWVEEQAMLRADPTAVSPTHLLATESESINEPAVRDDEHKVGFVVQTDDQASGKESLGPSYADVPISAENRCAVTNYVDDGEKEAS